MSADLFHSSFVILGSTVSAAIIPVLIIVVACLSFGLYQIIMDYIYLPSKKTRNAVLNMQKGKRSFTESFTIPVANFLVRKNIIRLSDERKNTMQKKLIICAIHYTPEFYTAKAVAEVILLVLIGALGFFIHPLLTIFMIVMAFAVYGKRMADLDDQIMKKAEIIDKGLVLFANTIRQNLSSTRDVMAILSSYRKVCSKDFEKELDITIVDMKTGNYETALRNLESRIPSVGLSEIIRGLLAVMRGDDQRNFFEMISHDLAVKEKEELKRAAIKRPEKLKPLTFAMLGGCLAMYLYVIIYVVAQQLQNLF